MPVSQEAGPQRAPICGLSLLMPTVPHPLTQNDQIRRPHTYRAGKNLGFFYIFKNVLRFLKSFLKVFY